MSRAWKIALTVAAGLVLLGLALWGVDLRAMRAHMARANPVYIGGAAALYLLAYFIRSLRWRLVLRPVARISVSEGYSMLMAGYFLNYVIPVRAGEVAKSFFLKRLKGVPVATSLPTVFVDKLLEMVSIVFIVIMVPVLSVRLTGALAGLIYVLSALFLVACAVLVLAYVKEEATTRLLCAAFAWLPARVHERLSEWIGLFVRGMSVAKHNATAFLPLLALTAASVLVDAAYFLLMFRAFAVDVGFVRVLFGYTLLTLSYILPTPPAQIGYNELVIGLIFAGGLTGAAIARDQVMAVVIVAHAITALLITGVGLWGFWAMGIRVTDSFRRASEHKDVEAAEQVEIRGCPNPGPGEDE
ncbi:MAG: flippase-like domain-containing protein [Candidatus Eisenbacteria bacterium]|nr:flippase-like domain-containing protein [Candidatus Eisenbacteria bacterium]